MMMQRNNPLMMLVQMAQNGGNPMQMIGQMAAQNPQARQALQLMQGKNPQQLEQMARNMAKERGTTVENLAQAMGLRIPNNR